MSPTADARFRMEGAIHDFLIQRIRTTKLEFDEAARELERTPHSRRARKRYDEAFYQYCCALHQSSVYSTDGIVPADFTPPA